MLPLFASHPILSPCVESWALIDIPVGRYQTVAVEVLVCVLEDVLISLADKWERSCLQRILDMNENVC